MSGSPLLSRQTFLERARQDHKACYSEVEGAFIVRTSRQAMVALLDAAIQSTAEKWHDDELYTAYRDIHILIQGWYWEDPIKSIIGTTLQDVTRGVVVRRRMPQDLKAYHTLQRAHAALETSHEELKSSHAALKTSYAALQSSHAALEKNQKILESINKMLHETLQAKSSQLATVLQENKQLRSDVEREKAEKVKLQQELAEARATLGSPKPVPTPPASDLPSVGGRAESIQSYFPPSLN